MTIIHIKLHQCLPDLDYHTRDVKIGHEVTANHFTTVKNKINLICVNTHTQTRAQTDTWTHRHARPGQIHNIMSSC